MTKTDCNIFGLTVFSKALCLKRRLDYRSKVFVSDMFYARPADQPRREQPSFIIIFGLLNTVSRKKYCPRKIYELFPLVLPRTSEIAGKVGVFFQFWITVRRQHLAVRINIYSLARRLLQKQIQVFQVVPADQYRFAFDWRNTNRGRLRVAESRCVGFVEHFHHFQIYLPAFHTHLNQRIDILIFRSCQKIQCLAEERIYLIGLCPEYRSVVNISSRSLEPINQKLLQSRHIIAHRRLSISDTDLLAEFDKFIDILAGREICLIFKKFGRLVGLSRCRIIKLFGFLTNLLTFDYNFFEPCRVKIDIGNRRKQRLDNEPVDLPVGFAEFGRPVSIHRYRLC